MSNKKIPIDKYGDGNCCPKCKSTRIDVHHQFPLEVYKDLRTGKERFYIYTSNEKKVTYRPSNRQLAERYIHSQTDSQVWYFECRKCGWISEPFTQ